MKTKILSLMAMCTCSLIFAQTNIYTVNNNVNTTGGNNALFGNNVGSALTTGAGNTYVGSTAGNGTNTNNNNTYLGFNATGSAGLTESGAIGADAQVTADRTIILGRANDASGTLPNVHVGIGATTAPAKLTVFNGPNPAFLSVSTIGAVETYDCIVADYPFTFNDAGILSISHTSNSANVGTASLAVDGADFNAGVIAMGAGGTTSGFNLGLFGAANGSDANRNWGVWGDVVVDDGLLNIGVAGIADDRCGTSPGAGVRINYGVYGSCDPFGGTPSGATTNWAGYFNGHVAGVSFFNTSDARFKQDVRELSSSLEKINALKFYSYTFNSKEYPQMNFGNSTHFGVLAQEVERVFPNLVANTRQHATEKAGVKYPEFEYKAVNYIELIPVTMQAVQELDKKFDALNKLLKEKGIDVATLNDVIKGEAYSKTNAVLEQNAPNPFNNETTIRYYVPENISKVLLVVMNLNGEVIIKDNNLQTGKQEFRIKAGELKSGTYFYSLFCDNELVATKKMIMLN